MTFLRKIKIQIMSSTILMLHALIIYSISTSRSGEAPIPILRNHFKVFELGVVKNFHTKFLMVRQW